jgi:hypothetical protein
MSKIEVNTVAPQCGTTLTLGESGDTVTLGSGASQTGFGRTGTVDWVTTIQTSSPFTAVSGKGYFINTTSGAITMNLPSSPSAGDIVSFKDYARTFGSNALTVGRGGSNMDGSAADSTFETNGDTGTLIYMDATKGWSLINDDNTVQLGASFITASGGTINTCGDFKTHVFTGPGTFTVCSVGNPAGSTTLDYLVVAGGGSGGWTDYGGGGGAGGFRVSNGYSLPSPTTSPLASPTSLTATVASFPITIGAGASNPGNPGTGGQGSTSTFSTISSAGGGGGKNSNNGVGQPGGSGGGGMGATAQSSGAYAGGTGNSPPVSPPQGNNGGAGYDGVAVNTQSGSGGGAGAAGGNASAGASAAGGIGSFVDSSFIGTSAAPGYGTSGPVAGTRYFAGGGGGAADQPSSTNYAGGSGGGGLGGNPSTPQSDRPGTTNTGGGAGAGSNPAKNNNGGSGIVMIRYKFQ